MTVRARNAVFISFFLNGFGFATWLSRVPQARESLGLTNSELGLLLLAMASGSVVTLPSAGALINRWGADRVVRIGVGCDVVGLVGIAVGAAVLQNVPVTALALFLYGLGVGSWDVAMNVEGTVVERRLARTVMPLFHASFSLGTVTAAAVGVLTTWAGVGMVPHLLGCALLMLVLAQATTGWFLPREAAPAGVDETAPPRAAVWRAWLEPRTLLIGLMVLALAMTEGTANDWLAIALIDGYDAPHWLGVAGFGVFVAAMTTGRVVGSWLLDRHGRVTVLWTTMAAAFVGVLLLVFGGHPVIVATGIVLWGLGASLGFPVGISAAADDELHAAARVSVVSTIAYVSFLAGPPLLGFIADQVGSLHAMLLVALLLIPSALVVPAAREPTGADR